MSTLEVDTAQLEKQLLLKNNSITNVSEILWEHWQPIIRYKIVYIIVQSRPKC